MRFWELILDPKVLAPISSGLTLIGKIVYDRWISEIGVSTETILSDLDKGHFLSSKRRKRLQQEADSNLAFWRRDLQPPTTGLKLESWPIQDKSIVARNLSTFAEDSACPTGDPNSSSTPLFVRLTDQEILSVKNSVEMEGIKNSSTDILGELENRFRSLEVTYKHSKELILHRKFSDKETPRIWIFAQNIWVRKREDAIGLLEKLTDRVRSRIPGARVVVEMYLSGDLQNQLKKYLATTETRSDNNKIDSTNLNAAARYTLAREAAMDALSRGIVLGRLQIPETHCVPKELLINHIPDKLDMYGDDSGGWSTISISGAPGAGKTELANLLIEKLKVDQKVITLIASTPQLLEEIERLFTYQSKEEAFEALVETIYNSPHEDQLIPEVQEGDIGRQAFRDALFDVLRDKKFPTVIVVDDLHAYSNISLTILRLRQQFPHWGIRFVLIGRTDVRSQEQEKFILIKCRLWNRQEARLILEDWLPTRRKEEFENILKRDWRKAQDEFSLYLLRIVTKHINVVEAAPSELLKTEINYLLSSVVKELELQQAQQPASLWLEKIKELLQANKEPKEILAIIEDKNTLVDPVLLFGALSWFSRFDERNALLDTSKVLKWTKNYIKDEDAATALLKAGKTADIFGGREGLYIWHDPLVADVCAALYLGHEVIKKKLGDAAVAQMVESLDKSDSIDFLRLALDPLVLVRIIQAVTNSRPDLAHVVDKLLTPEFVSRLAEDPVWIDALANDFWLQGQKVNPSQIEPVALALSKLIPCSRNLDERCLNTIKKAESDAMLALSVKALQLRDDAKYFEQLEVYAPQYLSPMILEMAARFWNSSGGTEIYRNLLTLPSLGYGEEEVRRIWLIWCKRQKSNDLLDMTHYLIHQVRKDTSSEKVCIILSDTCLRELSDRPPVERQKYLPKINLLKNEVSELAKLGLNMANKIVKWIAYYYCPDLVDKESQWVVDKKGIFAVPKTPNEPLAVAQIFALIGELYPKFEVAALSEIRRFSSSDEVTVELVRDKFPPDFRYSEQIMPVNLETWDGQSQSSGFISKDKIATLKIAWRPRLNLQPDNQF